MSTTATVEQETPALERRVCSDTVARCVHMFWRKIHGTRRGFLSLSSGFRIGRSIHGITPKHFAWPDEGRIAAEWVAREAGYGRDVYQIPYLLSRPKLNSREQVYVVAADLDGASYEELPSPTIIVETSPQRRQAYWKLREPITAEVANQLSIKVQQKVGSPLNMPHFLRVPGIPNHKYHHVSVSMTAHANSYSPGYFASMVGIDPFNLEFMRQPPGLIDWIKRAPGPTAKVLRGAVASAVLLILTLSSIGLKGSAGPHNVAVDGSREEKTVITATSPEAKLAYLQLGASPTVLQSGSRRATPKAYTIPRDEYLSGFDSPPTSNPIAREAAAEFDVLRKAGQAILDVRHELP